MKLRGIFRFELAYQLRRPLPWVFFIGLLLFAYLLTGDGTLAEALREDFYLDSPFAIAKNVVGATLVWLLVAGGIAGEAAARDVATGMHPLMYTTPISKTDYLGGRFLAALVIHALIMLAVPAGILLAAHSPGVEDAVRGPFRPAAYLTAYAFLTLPNIFLATAIQFWLATRSRRPIASYAGGLLLFFMAYAVSGIVAFQLGRPELGRMLDPMGALFIVTDLSLSWTPIEKSTRLIGLEGLVLRNRLLWIGIGLAALAATHLGFRFAHPAGGGRRRRRTRRTGERGPAAVGARGAGIASGARAGSGAIAVPRAQRTFRFGTRLRQTAAMAWTSFRVLTTSRAGLALLALLPLFAGVVVLGEMDNNGVPLIPTSARVVTLLSAPLAAEATPWLIIPLLIAFCAGELVWRERDAGLGEITDTMPASEWLPLLGKFLGLALVLVVWLALVGAGGAAAQTMLGGSRIDLGLYLKVLFGLQLVDYLLFAMLALVVHVVVDHKYVGHLVVVSAYAVIAMASLFGLEHNLLIYGDGPGWAYTEMRGFGPFLGPWLWFKLYWVAWAVALAVLAKLLWVRGREAGLRARLRLARGRFGHATAGAAVAAAALIATLGGFIFYNTNVLNDFYPASEIDELRAEYERRYGRFEDVPQPRLIGTSLHVEIYPDRRQAEIRGSHRLVNRSDAPIDSIHVAIPRGAVETRAVSFDRAAAPVLADEVLGHRIYSLEEPLEPGDALRLDFEVHYDPQGFGNDGVPASVVENGTRITLAPWLPEVGYESARELTGARDRREHGLPSRPAIFPALHDPEARQEAVSASADRIAFDAVIGTAEDQVAVAPGVLRRTWTEPGRRYFRYSADAPIGEVALFSAEYAVHEARWNDVLIRVFHHPEHVGNLERMVRSARASLDLYTEQFGPYPYGQLTIVEQPGHGTGMHANTGMLIYQEGFSFWNPGDDPGSLDLPFAVMAHEAAHQWWGGQLPYALLEGAPVLSESLAWYSAIQVVDEHYGRDHARRLLTFMRRPYPYPPIRRGVPLLRGLDPYVAYRKGPFALYALGERIGHERVNDGLRRLLEKHRWGEPRLATTLDLYRELQAVTPDSVQPLLHDLFEANTFWELEAGRATAAKTADSRWRVTLEVRARKVVVDSAGVETEVPMGEWVEIGVFAPPSDGAGELSNPLYVGMRRIRSGEQTVTVTVPEKPLLAGIDPYHLLDWKEGGDDDNIDSVRTVPTAEGTR